MSEAAYTSGGMLAPANHLDVTAAFPVTAATPLGSVAVLLAKLLADTKHVLTTAYGVGQRVPPATEVPWRLQAGPDGTEVVVFVVRVSVPDGGAAFRAELARRQQVAEMLARVAQAPAGPA